MSGLAIKNPFKGKAHAGPSGPSGTLSVGSTTTLSAGSPATVTNTGTPEAGVFNFGIPAGVKGDPGNPGADGDDGRRGSLWFQGGGSPSVVALPNDMYLDLATGDVWQFT